MPIHKIITGGEQWLPFALSKLRSMKQRLGPDGYGSNQFTMPDGAEVKVRQVGQQQFLRIDGGPPIAICTWRHGIFRTWRQPTPTTVVVGTNTVPDLLWGGFYDPERIRRYATTYLTRYAIRPIRGDPDTYAWPFEESSFGPIPEAAHLTLLTPDGQYAAQVQDGVIKFLGPPEKPETGQDQGLPTTLAIVPVAPLMPGAIPYDGVILRPSSTVGRTTPVLLSAYSDTVVGNESIILHKIVWVDLDGNLQTRSFADIIEILENPVTSLGEWGDPSGTYDPFNSQFYSYYPGFEPALPGTSDSVGSYEGFGQGVAPPQQIQYFPSLFDSPFHNGGSVIGGIRQIGVPEYERVPSSTPGYGYWHSISVTLTYSVEATAYCPKVTRLFPTCVVGAADAIYALVEESVMTTVITDVHKYTYNYVVTLRLHTYYLDATKPDTEVVIATREWSAVISYAPFPMATGAEGANIPSWPGQLTAGYSTFNPRYELKGSIIVTNKGGKPHIDVIVTTSAHSITADVGAIISTDLYRKRKKDDPLFEVDPFAKTELLRRGPDPSNVSAFQMNNVEFVSGAGLAREWYPEAGITSGKTTYFLGGHVLIRVPPEVVDGVETTAEYFVGGRPQSSTDQAIYIHGSATTKNHRTTSLDSTGGIVRRMSVRKALDFGDAPTVTAEPKELPGTELTGAVIDRVFSRSWQLKTNTDSI